MTEVLTNGVQGSFDELLLDELLLDELLLDELLLDELPRTSAGLTTLVCFFCFFCGCL